MAAGGNLLVAADGLLDWGYPTSPITIDVNGGTASDMAGGTLAIAGTLDQTGTSTIAAGVSGGSAGVLVIDAGGSLSEVGEITVAGTLVIAAGSGDLVPGRLTEDAGLPGPAFAMVVAGTFINHGLATLGSFTVDSTGTLIDDGIATINSLGAEIDGTVTGTGLFVIDGTVQVGQGGRGALSVATIENDGTLSVSAAALLQITSAVTSDAGRIGSLVIDGGTLVLGGAVAASQSIMFEAGNGTLNIEDPSHFASIISIFYPDDVIDIAAAANTELYAGGTLTLSDDGRPVATLAFSDHRNPGDFTIRSDGRGGTLLTTQVDTDQIAAGQTVDNTGTLTFIGGVKGEQGESLDMPAR